MRRMIAILTMGLLLATAGAAQAGVPTEVDQSGLQPPLNPDFTYRCFAQGGGVLCQGVYDPSWTAEPIDLTCDGEPILTTGSGHERLQRWHLADGRATRTIVQLHYQETWTLASTGRSVALLGDWNRHYVYPVPGDRAQRILTEVGSSFRITAPGSGLIAHDAGLIRFAPGEDFETPVDTHGPHDTWADFDAVIAKVCAVLGA